jgi:type IV pilus assembly protein PilY1
MNHLCKLTVSALALLLSTFVASTAVRADDIDLFLGTPAAAVNAPNIIFLIDNSTNWSRAAQHWPDNGGIQGAAELAAVSTVLNQINASTPANVGLAMLSNYAGTSNNGATPGTGGGYIRFGVRDMTVPANKLALQNILAGIAANITDPAEKVNTTSKDEDAAFYEIYKYLSGLKPFTGLANQNVFADIAGNPQLLSGAGQNLTSGFAFGNNGEYVSPISAGQPCAATYIIYVANNANNFGSSGRSAYESTIANVAPALSATSLTDTWTDEWTYFLNTNGVVVPAGNNNGAVVTYVLDAFNAQDDVGYSNSLRKAAAMGGGGYYPVGSQQAIAAALGHILSQIQAVNSTFASASLPVNTTNRAQNLNQVFIPMFRPDASANPRWMGNLKEYQLISSLGSLQLGDNSSPPINAVNPLTGFVTPCAQSFWTTDSGTYWAFDASDAKFVKGLCPPPPAGVNLFSQWSDSPDGPIVEKGGAAEVIRKGNNPPLTNTTPTWLVNRTIYTLALNALNNAPLTLFNSTSLGAGNANLANFISGYDVNLESTLDTIVSSRPSLHGDEVHSRPLPIDYGGGGVTVYYGSNDGTLRAVDASSGAERWAFIAPEFYSTLAGFSRLMNNSPQISYFGQPSAGIAPPPVPKDYYFDGSIGAYQTANGSQVWIYPSMRRGGRMIYAFDVTNPVSPKFMWKAGCPYAQSSATPTAGCTSQMGSVPGMSAIGETWSTPTVAASVPGYTGPVIIMGGGYDTCEDVNAPVPSLASPACTTTNGAGVYVLDATTGTVLATFPTLRSVAADVALIAVTTPGVIDHAYAVDTGGNIYRLDFAASQVNWTMHQVAATTLNAGRKFLFAPALLAAPGGNVYVALGSGDREHPLQSEYPYSTSMVNRFYVYLDDLSTTSSTPAINLDDTTSSSAVMYDYTTAPGSTSTTSTTSCSSNKVLPGSSKKGWFITLQRGEQTVSGALIAGGMVAFSTNQPTPAVAGTCSNLGLARGYWVNLFNASGGIGVPGASCGGARSSLFAGGGLPPSPVLATVVVNGQTMTVAIGTAQLSGGVSSPISPQQILPSIVPTRKKIYWKSSGDN